MNKDPNKSQYLKARILNIEIGEVRIMGKEWIKAIIRLAKELEESQINLNPKGEDTLPKPCHPREGVTTQGKAFTELANIEGTTSSVIEERGVDELVSIIW